MPASQFDAVVRPRGEMTVIDLRGDINAAAGDALDTAFTQALVAGAATVVLNFVDVDYINSTGIALIVGVLARARAGGRDVRACGLAEHYREIFTITRLSDFMGLYPDEATAVAGGHDSPAPV